MVALWHRKGPSSSAERADWESEAMSTLEWLKRWGFSTICRIDLLMAVFSLGVGAAIVPVGAVKSVRSAGAVSSNRRLLWHCEVKVATCSKSSAVHAPTWSDTDASVQN